jgi:hypothetical protein
LVDLLFLAIAYLQAISKLCSEMVDSHQPGVEELHFKSSFRLLELPIAPKIAPAVSRVKHGGDFQPGAGNIRARRLIRILTEGASHGIIILVSTHTLNQMVPTDTIAIVILMLFSLHKQMKRMVPVVPDRIRRSSDKNGVEL